MSGRIRDRKKRRMPCQLYVGESVHSGLVLDLSQSGLFIQTSAKTRPGQRLKLSLARDERETLEIEVEVVRKKVVPARLVAVAQGGVGVRIVDAPEHYYEFVEEIGAHGGEAHPGAAAPGPGTPADEADATDAESSSDDGLSRGLHRYRVRVSQVSGPRSRRLMLDAADSQSAVDEALEQMGDGWKVLEVESV